MEEAELKKVVESTGLSGDQVVNLLNGLVPLVSKQGETAAILTEIKEAVGSLKAQSVKQEPAPAPQPKPKEESNKRMDEEKIKAMFQELQANQQKQMDSLKVELLRSETLRKFNVPEAFEGDVRGNTAEELAQSAKSAISRYESLMNTAKAEVLSKFNIPADATPELFEQTLKSKYAPPPTKVPESEQELMEQISSLPEHLQTIIKEAKNAITNPPAQGTPDPRGQQFNMNAVSHSATHPNSAGEPVGYNSLNIARQNTAGAGGGNPGFGQQTQGGVNQISENQVKGMSISQYADPSSQQAAHALARAALEAAI